MYVTEGHVETRVKGETGGSKEAAVVIYWAQEKNQILEIPLLSQTD
jgi:hypothetical protein